MEENEARETRTYTIPYWELEEREEKKKQKPEGRESKRKSGKERGKENNTPGGIDPERMNPEERKRQEQQNFEARKDSQLPPAPST